MVRMDKLVGFMKIAPKDKRRDRQMRGAEEVHLVHAEAGVGLVPVVAHQQHEDEGRDAEDEAGEAEHDGGDHLLQPGRHAPRHPAGGVLQPVQGARIPRARPLHLQPAAET